ncbi:MAG: phosphoribosylanthranilate isomerase [Caldisphaera sp.]|jgi:phosphoribosylanthranilate isomerase|nr:MAG: N-(5'-phosphoribosyl)anthranilate isomerase [Caldisphaera sp.]
MVIKIKICGVNNLEDVKMLNSFNIDFIGMINDKISPRYVDEEKIQKAMEITKIPIVTVIANYKIEDIQYIKTKYIQIHRILNDNELEELKNFNKKFILYVPSSLKYLDYLKKTESYSDMILLDTLNKNQKADKRILRKMIDHSVKIGIAGGINADNIKDFIDLDPYWIDISRGVEILPGKKDPFLVKKILEVVKNY